MVGDSVQKALLATNGIIDKVVAKPKQTNKLHLLCLPLLLVCSCNQSCVNM